IMKSNDEKYWSLDNSRELLEDYKYDKVFLACYGTQLFDKLIEYKQNELIEDILRGCLDLSIRNTKEGFTANIELLCIITSSFSELSQNYTAYISDFLSQIAFSNPTIQLMIPLPKFVTYPYPYNPWLDLVYPTPRFIMFAFANSLYFLLRSSNYYSSDTINSNNSNPNTITFETFQSSILATYLMLLETSISTWIILGNITLVILLVIFSFTMMYLMNLFIGLLSNAINDTNNKESFLILRAEVLAEIELFYMLPYQRRKNNWFPQIIYFEAHINKLREIIRQIEKGNYPGNKPFISQILLNTIEMKSIESDELQQVIIINDSLKKFRDSIQESKDEIKNLIEELKRIVNKNR
ncbi:11309_t:CDS:2, partial [Racocetra persica]